MNALDFPTKYCLSPADKARLLEKAIRLGHTPDTYVETLIKRDLFAPSYPEAPARKPRTRQEAVHS